MSEPFPEADTAKLLGLFADAVHVRAYHPSFFPMVFQLDEYRRAIQGKSRWSADAERYIEMLQANRGCIQRPSLRYEALIDESVLHRPLERPGLLSEQLEHAVALAELPNVTLRVVPFSAGLRTSPDGAFILVDMPSVDGESRGDRWLYREPDRGHLTKEDNDAISWFEEGFAAMSEVAVDLADIAGALPVRL